MMDKSSPEFMFGQIMARLGEGDKAIDGLTVKVDSLVQIVNKLPCEARGMEIESIKDWQAKHNRRQERSGEMSLKFKHGLVIGLSAAVISGLMTLFVGWITGMML